MHAEEKTNQCEDMTFQVEPLIVGDEKLAGEGQTGQEIELLFDNLNEIIEVADDGSFEYEWENEVPEKDDTIILTNKPYELELIVKEETTETEPIEAELVGLCEEKIISEDEEETEDEVQTDEGEEQLGDIEEVNQSDEDKEQPKDGDEENSEVDEVAEDAPAEGGTDKEEETQLEEQTDGGKEQPEEDQETVENISSEVEPSETNKDLPEEFSIEEREEKDLEEEVIEEDLSEELESEGESQEEETAEETDSASEVDHEEETGEETEEVEGEEEKSDEESIQETNEKKLKEEELESSEDVESKKGEKPSDRQKMTVFSSFEAASAIDSKSQVSTKEITGDTMTVSTATDFNYALSSESIERIFLEADIEQPNPPTVESQSGQKIIETNGYDINLVNSTMLVGESVTNMVIRDTSASDRSTNLYTTNSDKDDGFIRKRDALMYLHLENINFNMHANTSAGKFGSNWEGEVHLYGDNVMNTFNSENAFAFRKIVIHDYSSLKLRHSSNNPTFMFYQDVTSSGSYGIEVGEYAELEVESNNGAILETERLRDTILNFTVDQRANVNMTGSNSSLFDLYTEIHFSIINPESVDFNNLQRNGRLFPVNGGLINGWLRNNDVNFKVENSSLKGWRAGNKSGTPSSSTPLIEKAHFKFTTIWILAFIERTEVTSITPSMSGFSNMFPPSVGRMVFERSMTGILEFGAPPEDLIFETTDIKDEEKVIKRQPLNYEFEVVDTRKNGDWKLVAEAIKPLNDSKGNEMKGSIYFFNQDKKPILLEEGPVEIISKNMNNKNPTQQVSWGPEEGILLKLNPINATADEKYTTTINWTLSDGP
jgi:hypothetical protein